MATVRPIPEGFRRITPHLVVDGAAKAIDFYKKAFGAIEVRRAPAPDGKKLMHAELRIGDSVIMLADDFPEWGCPARNPNALGGSAVTIHQFVEDTDAAMQRAVAAGATVTMPAADMFWGDRYGTIKDPFGHEWSFGTHIKDMTPKEMEAAAKEFFANGAGCGH